MRTPMQQLIERLEEAYEANPTHSEYRKGLAEAIGLARALLPVEEAHLRASWRDGAQGILHQTAGNYFRTTYLDEEEE